MTIIVIVIVSMTVIVAMTVSMLSKAGAAAAPDGLAALLAQFELLNCKDLLEKEGIFTVAHLKDVEESDVEKLESKLGVLNIKRFRKLLEHHVPQSPSPPKLHFSSPCFLPASPAGARSSPPARLACVERGV